MDVAPCSVDWETDKGLDNIQWTSPGRFNLIGKEHLTVVIIYQYIDLHLSVKRRDILKALTVAAPHDWSLPTEKWFLIPEGLGPFWSKATPSSSSPSS